MKKYTKFKKKFLDGARGVALAGVFLIGASSTYAAQNPEDYSPKIEIRDKPSTGMHKMRRWNSKTRIQSVVSQLDLSEEEIQQELQSGKSMKQILQENGIDMANFGK